MFAGSLILGFTLFFFAGWLHWNEQRGWPNELFETDLDREYRNRRLRSRMHINYLIAACGGSIVVSAFAGPGMIWMICWCAVIIALLLVVFLAFADAIRSHRYLRKKLPEIREQTFGDTES